MVPGAGMIQDLVATGYHWLSESMSQGRNRLPLVTLILVSGWLP